MNLKKIEAPTDEAWAKKCKEMGLIVTKIIVDRYGNSVRLTNSFMNAQQRKALSKLISELEDLNSRGESIRDEEQEKLDNMHENMKIDDKGSELENIVSQ